MNLCCKFANLNKLYLLRKFNTMVEYEVGLPSKFANLNKLYLLRKFNAMIEYEVGCPR